MPRRHLFRGAKALFYAVTVHAALAVMLGITLTGGTPQVQKKPPPTVVQATVVDEEAMQKALAQIAAEEKKKKAAAEKRRREAAERERIKKEQQRAAERKRAAEIKQAAERKRAEEQRKKIAAAEAAKAAAAEAARKKREAEKKAEEEKTKAEALAAVAERMAFIKRRVDENWFRPRDAKSGLRAEFLVKIAVGGRVEVVTLRKSSGDQIFDRSAEVAIFRASPLPIPDNPRYQRHYREGFIFIFDPEPL